MESLEGVGQNLSPLPGWANATTPLYATPVCGSIIQTGTYTTSGAVGVFIGFQQPATWSSVEAWTSDASGVTWTCQIPGIYSMNIAQTLNVQNLSDITNPIVSLVMSMVDGNNAELDQVYTTNIPIPVTIDPIVICQNVSNIVNANVGTTMEFGVTSPSGGITITSAGNSGYYQAFTYNLIARGVYGNVVV